MYGLISAFGFAKRVLTFQNILRVFQTETNCNCSGKRVGSAAASKASSANIADAVWCPCPPLPSVAKRVMIISGLKLRITQTISLKIESWLHLVKVSSGFLLKPKSYARVKNCSPPSILRAANNSCVRIIPNSMPCSEPIKFCPPSPRVKLK